MQPHETSFYSITEKAKSERLFMHYALLLACLLVLIGTGLIVLGIGDHLDIVVTGTGSLEARFINASPGFGLAMLGLFIFGWAKPRRLKLNAKHSSVQSSPIDRLEEFEDSMRDLMIEIEGRNRRIHQQWHERLVAEIKRLTASQSGALSEQAPSQSPQSHDSSKPAPQHFTQEVTVAYSRKTPERPTIPPFDPNQTDAEKIQALVEWANSPQGEDRTSSPSKPQTSNNDEIDVLYQDDRTNKR
jgi:hypothetical protein